MSPTERVGCTKALSTTIKDLASLDFPAYGSLYFSDAPLDASEKIPFAEGFCIGPLCSPIYWNRGPGELELYGEPSSNHGPWKDLKTYSLGLIDTGLARIPQDTTGELAYRGSRQDHRRLLEGVKQILQRLVEDKRIEQAATPALLHPDFHARNIYLSEKDPTIVTGLIDWQTASLEPAFIYANETPDFVNLPARLRRHLKLNLTRYSKERDAGLGSYETYHSCMSLVPKLSSSRMLYPILFHLFRSATRTWTEGAALVRRDVWELSVRWEELKLPGSCPYSFTEQEIEQQAQNDQDFRTVRDLTTRLERNLRTNTAGWVPIDVWEAAKTAHREMYDEWIDAERAAGGSPAELEMADRL
ncbi:hypothetical protein FE257_009681 [Aspergillus nanangensis]|uniref:Altered inheritance of mitochondria protein 9, mitochondrial n=1 Tax=Aspergillus nanangensis TaxID=2582783 RepID=A0AAD4GTS5_ASPNN|nr:hypothetical protein FE257_009681 [Aspergillus nanangensis]